MATSNHVSKVAVVGAGGNSGRLITEALLKTGKHIVTALTRAGSQSELPQGIATMVVDYDKPETLVDALRGQDVLVITLSGTTPNKVQENLIHAAGEAGVQWIIPNEWSPDTTDEALVKDVTMFQQKVTTRETIEKLKKSSYIAICTGFWYEWSLAVPGSFGIDFANHAVTFFDKGETKISVSTLPQVGRAVAALLSLPVKSEGSSSEACLENLRNKVVYINSFTVSHKDMFESALRVTGTMREEWAVKNEASHERFTTGMQEIQQGNFSGFSKLVARLFYPDGCGDFEHNKGTLNDILGLPKEDIDEATKVAIARSKSKSH